MKKLSVIILIILFLLLGAAELYVQSDAFALKIRPFVVKALQDALGANLDVGWVRANLVPPYIEARDLSFVDAHGKQVAAIRKVRLYIDPVPLLVKKIRLPLISVLEPRLFAVRARDGALNITPLIERIKSTIAAKPSQGPSPYGLLLRTITIKQGHIAFKDEATSVQVSSDDFNIAAKVGYFQDSVTTTVKSPQIRISSPAYPDLLGGLKASLDYYEGRVRIQSIALTTVDASINLEGTAGPMPEAPLNLKLTISTGPKLLRRFMNIIKPIADEHASRIEATALIQGTLFAPIINGSVGSSAFFFRGITLRDGYLSFAYRDLNLSVKGANWKLSEGDQRTSIERIDGSLGYRNGTLDIKNFDVRAEDLFLHLEGTVDPSSGFDAFLKVESSAKGRTISFLSSMPLEGSASVQGHFFGAPASPRFDGTISAHDMSVRKIPFSHAEGGIQYDHGTITLTSVDIREWASHYVFDGSVDVSGKEAVYAARLKVLRSDVVNVVALFYEQLPLKLSATGELLFNGTARDYSGSGYLKLDAGSAYGESFTRGAVTASLTTGKIAFPQVVLYKERGVVKATGWIGFDGNYSADLESRDIDLSKFDSVAGLRFGGESRIEIHTAGSFDHPKVKATLAVDELTYRSVPLGGLRGQAEIKDGALSVISGLSEERARLTLQWTLHKPYAWTATAKIKVEGLDPFLLAGRQGLADRVKLGADGAINAHGQGTTLSALSGGALFQRLNLLIGDYRLDNESEAAVTVESGRLAVSSLNFAGPGTRINVSGWAKLLSKMDLTFLGTANLSLLKLMYGEVEHAAGTADVKLTVKDDWNNPDVAGELRLQDGAVKIKDVPQRFSSLNGKISFTQGKIVTDSLAGVMGGGALGVSGWAQLSGFALQDFSVKASVDNVTVRYPEGLTSTLSGDIFYDGDASEQSLSGDITIKRSRYDKRIEWKSMLVDIGRGLYQKKKTEIGWIGETQINVRFHGSDDILFQNNLAKMPLDVDVFLRGTVNHPQLLGRIEVRKGTVFFRKNEFHIIHGAADFIDPGRMNPVIDIQAETQVREYQIRLAVTGTADHAVVTFISEPPLTDADILSLLALGKRGSELKGKEGGVGMGEAASFASGQFQDVFERRARSLTGFDRFQIDPYVNKNDTSVPRVTMSKEIVQNRLYVTYSQNVGASTPEQMFRIEYILNRHFSLVGDRDEQGSNGADIKYRFEFK